MKRQLRAPFLIVNPKAYIYGKEALELAKTCEELAVQYDVDIIYTAQHTDLRMIADATEHIIVTAQHMDGIVPGRGMGHILPESIVDAGAQAVVLNHSEHPLGTAALAAAMKRAKELDLITIICADTPEECAAVAQFAPDVMIIEPVSGIGTGHASSDDYMNATNAAVRAVNPDIFILQAAGISTGEDVYRSILNGSHASGGTSGILKAPDRRAKIIEMIEAMQKAAAELEENHAAE